MLKQLSRPRPLRAAGAANSRELAATTAVRTDQWAATIATTTAECATVTYYAAGDRRGNCTLYTSSYANSLEFDFVTKRETSFSTAF